MLGIVWVEDYSYIEWYSYVMYLVFMVIGKFGEGCIVLDVVIVCFLVGMLLGVLKVWVMELIEEVEKICCGFYGGVVGYFDFVGNVDFVIVICIVLMCNGMVYV